MVNYKKNQYIHIARKYSTEKQMITGMKIVHQQTRRREEKKKKKKKKVFSYIKLLELKPKTFRIPETSSQL